MQFIERLFVRPGRPIRPRRRQRIEDVDDSDNLREQRDLSVPEPVGVASPVEELIYTV